MAEGRFGFSAFQVVLSATAAGSTEIIAAQTGIRYRVVAAYMISSNTNSVTFQSASDAITGVMDFTSQERMTLPLNEYGWFTTAEGEALNLNLTNSYKVAGILTYFHC